MERTVITATRNMDVVNEILSVPEIWEAISDGIPLFEMPYMPDVTYFLVNERDGVIIFHPFRDGVKIHPNIVPEKRGRLAYQAVEAACQEMHKIYRNIYAEIAPELVHIIRFAKHLGFRHLQSGDRELLVRRRLDS